MKTGVFISPNNSTIISSIPQAHTGIASGTVASFRNMGMVIGVALSRLIFNSIFHALSGGFSLKVYMPEMEVFFMTAFKWAMLSGGSVAGAGVVVAFLRGPETGPKK